MQEYRRKKKNSYSQKETKCTKKIHTEEKDRNKEHKGTRMNKEKKKLKYTKIHTQSNKQPSNYQLSQTCYRVSCSYHLV